VGNDIFGEGEAGQDAGPVLSRNFVELSGPKTRKNLTMIPGDSRFKIHGTGLRADLGVALLP